MTIFPIDLEGYSPLEVFLPNPDNFLTIRETLTRIGIASQKTKTLYQSCHIFHRRGEYFIVHFKEMMALDGHSTNISLYDIQRRNTIARLLEEWGLLEIADPYKFEQCAPISSIKIIPFKEKKEWKLEEKYKVGRPKRA